MSIIDTHRERRNSERNQRPDGQIEELKQRASAAEIAVQQLKDARQDEILYHYLRAQQILQKRQSFKLLDLTFSCWANHIDENAFEKMLDSRPDAKVETAATRTSPPPRVDGRTSPTVLRTSSSTKMGEGSLLTPSPPPRKRGSTRSPPERKSTSPNLSTPPTSVVSPLLQSLLTPPQPLGLSDVAFQLIGLKLKDKMPPYIVEHGSQLIDVFAATQHDAAYCNQPVEAGDELLFVDGVEVTSLGPSGVIASLRGQTKSQVHLVFSSARNSSLFRITVLRHAQSELL